eukprot:279619_1
MSRSDQLPVDMVSIYASVLTSSHKLVYNQWILDPNDVLLFSGYFRETMSRSHQLPSDIQQIMTSYYSKEYSKKQIHGIIDSKILRLEQESRERREQLKWTHREQRRTKWMDGEQIVYILCVLFAISFIFGPDIIGLIIETNNDCTLALNNDVVGISVDEYLLIGCISHIILITISIGGLWFVLYSAKEDNFWDDSIFYCCSMMACCVVLLFFSWSIVGFILYSDIDSSTSSNKQCADIVISWSVLTAIECLAPFFCVVVIFLFLLCCARYP